MFRNLTVFVILISLSCAAFTEQASEDDIELRILNDELYIKNDSIALEIQISNSTDSTYLMFAFKMVHEGIWRESFFTDSTLNFPSGTATFIYDEAGNTLEQHEPDIDTRTFDDLRDIKKQTDEAYLNRMLILKPDTSIRLTLRVNLKYFEPGSGIYNVHLIHYSGKNFKNFVPEEKVRQLKQEHHASVFQGWIKSNSVKLIVE